MSEHEMKMTVRRTSIAAEMAAAGRPEPAAWNPLPYWDLVAECRCGEWHTHESGVRIERLSARIALHFAYHYKAQQHIDTFLEGL